MKKILLVVIGVMAAFGAQATEQETPKYPGTQYMFPDGLKDYGPGTKVENDGRQFECKPFPESGFCTQYSESADQYEPGKGKYWKVAWNDITPDNSGGFDFDFHFPDGLGHYTSGTTVEHEGEVYRCREWPYGGFCSQWKEGGNEQYEPGTGEYWEYAWDYLGPANPPKN